MLAPDHADRRQLSDLMTPEPPARPALPAAELPAAPAARIREVINDLIDLILGTQLTTRAPMPRLTPGLTLPALQAHQLLGLRTRLSPPLSPCLRWILGRRPGARARVLTRCRLQTSQPLLKLLDPRSEIENELDTRLTTSVIDRLRLRALHNPRIR